ncbi:hydroxysqualene dehydroxylase [Geminicoccus flavidas]|uniref:hydroxysqualene dehydroxylase n=1 Tax=Geminicoccus flavidas TaxID=2506407 RepID=UPI001357CAB6|nr:FAD-dependent oxidoreductase [Geminicoccus flavidas]
MSGQLHVVGGGISGLAAAVLAMRAGWRPVVHEAAPQPGGRCRTVRRGDISHDNGTHVLLSANRATLRLLDAVGAAGRWVEPEPDGLPVLDLESGRLDRVGLSPWSWLRPGSRPMGLAPRDLLRLARIAVLPGRRSVAAAAGDAPGLARMLDLMAVAVLNTTGAAASATLLARVLRRMAMPGGTRLLVARTGLGPDLVQPLADAVMKGGEIRLGRRLRAIEQADGQAVALRFGGGTVQLEAGDRVVLALPPAAAASVLPGLPVPTRFAPIVNLHFPHNGEDPIRFAGITGGIGQWLLVRPGMASVTISAGFEALELPGETLAARVWPEVTATTARLGIGLPGGGPENACVVKERFATPFQDDAQARARRPGRTPLRNLALAGDWTTGLPATIEAAVVAAGQAVQRLGRPATERAGTRMADATA